MKYSLLRNINYVFRKLFLYKKSQALLIFIGIILSVVLPFSSVLLPPLAIKLITGGASTILFVEYTGLLIFGIALLSMINIYVRALYMSTNMPARLDDFVVPLISRIIRTDYENIEYHENQVKSQKAGDSVSSNYRGIELMMNQVPEIIIQFLGLIIFAAFIGSLSIYIILVFVVMTIFNVLLTSYSKYYERKHRNTCAALDKEFDYLYTNSKLPSNGKDVRVYKMEEWFYDVFTFLTKKRSWWQSKIENRNFLPNLSDSFFLLVRDLIAYTIIISKFINGGLDATTFTFYTGLIIGFSLWLNGVIQAYNQVKKANIGVTDYRSFIDLEDKWNHGSSKHEIDYDKAPKIEFRNVTFSYPNALKPVINNFNLIIESTDKLAIVGLNGAGKTTLVKLMSGLYTPTSGEILVNDINIMKYNIDEYYKLLGVIFQDCELLAFNLVENITGTEQKAADRSKLYDSLKYAGLLDFIEKLDHKEMTYYTQILDDKGVSFSGGEVQKILFSRALYKGAKFVILDEPTSALDPIAESELYEKYNEIMNDKTSVFISHRLSSTRFCDRIILLDNGAIIESGSHDELMNSNGKYKEMYEIQAKYYREGGLKDEN